MAGAEIGLARTKFKQASRDPFRAAISAGGKAVMHLCQGNDGGVPPAIGKPPVHIRFIEEKPKRLVKSANLGQGGSAKGAVGSDRFGHQRRVRRVDGDILISGQIQRMIIAKPIHRHRPPLQGNTIAATDHATGGPDLRIFKSRDQTREPARLGHRIIIAKGHDSTGCGLQAKIARLRYIRRWAGYKCDPVPIREQRRHGLGLIGHDHQLKIAVALVPERGHRPFEAGNPIPVQDNYGNAGLGCHGIFWACMIASIRATSTGLFNSQNA